MMRIQPIGCESLLLRLYLYFIIRSPFLPLNAGCMNPSPTFLDLLAKKQQMLELPGIL